MHRVTKNFTPDHNIIFLSLTAKILKMRGVGCMKSLYIDSLAHTT